MTYIPAFRDVPPYRLVNRSTLFGLFDPKMEALRTSQGKVLPRTGHEGPEGEQMYSSTLPSTSALDGGGWSTPPLDRFTPGKDPVAIVQETGWVRGPVWTGAGNLAPTGIRSSNRPARSESLYRLSYPGPYAPPKRR